MPRRSPNDFPLTGAHSLLQPPAELDELERAEFASIVLSAPKGLLSASDVPLIAIYAAAIVLERTARGELRASGHVVDGKPSPWRTWLKDARETITTTARMLQLNPAGRQSLTVEQQRQTAGTSYYSRMALEAQRDGSQSN